MTNLRIDIEGKDSIEFARELAHYLLKTGCAKVVSISEDDFTTSLEFPLIEKAAIKRITDESKKWSATKNLTFLESEGKLERLTLEGTTTETFHIITISN